jgi:hypothetical protein
MQATGQEKSIPRGDRRNDQRFDCEEFISCSSFNNHETFEGQMLNFSKSGVYFESDAILRPGTTIYFRLIKCTVFPTEPTICEGLRNTSLAEVIWCKEVNNQGERCFGMGVKYYKTWHFKFRNNQHSDERG